MGLLTTQHSHKLLQQIQDLLDVHQVLGLQTLPEDRPVDSKQGYSNSNSLLSALSLSAQAFLSGVFPTTSRATDTLLEKEAMGT